MARNLVIGLLLPAMLLGGLWVVCKSGPSDGQRAGTGSSTQSEEEANCARICALKHRANAGAICLLLPGSDTSISVLDFGAAILPSEISPERIAAAESMVIEAAAFYSNPILSDPNPPPRAG